MCRIQLTDTAMEAVAKMCDGNPGSITAMMQIMTEHDEIDPQAMMGGIGAIMILDTWKIYGTEIYILWSDKCGRDVRKMLMLMRATQLGIFPQAKLNEMAKDQMRQVDLTDEMWADLDKQVCDRLPEFKRAA